MGNEARSIWVECYCITAHVCWLFLLACTHGWPCLPDDADHLCGALGSLAGACSASGYCAPPKWRFQSSHPARSTHASPIPLAQIVAENQQWCKSDDRCSRVCLVLGNRLSWA